MITLLITRYGCPEGIYLRLPATPADIGAVFAELDSFDTDTSTTSILSVESPVPNLGLHIGDANPEEADTMEKLNRLASKLRDMDEQSITVLSAALEAERTSNLDDVLDIAEHTDDYILLHGVTTHKQLGEFVVDTGYKSFPSKVLPYLDFAVIGAEYISQRGGAFTSAGYVLRKTAEQEQTRERESVFRITLRNGVGETYELHLPATENELDAALKRLRIEEFAEATLERNDCITYLSELIPNDGISVEDANDLALEIEQMQMRDGELMKFLSVLEVERPQAFGAALNLAWYLDEYERIPNDPAEYGRMVVERYTSDYELFETIDDYMDYRSLGEDCMRTEDVRRTAFGLVRCVNGEFGSPSQEAKASASPVKAAAPEPQTLKLYMPLTADVYGKDEWGDTEQYSTPLNGAGLRAYEDEISSAIERESTSDPVRGLMEWYDREDTVSEKVRSVVFAVEERDGELWGVAECRVEGTLSQEELSLLKDYITGQAADGWGEGFEQRAIHTDEGEMYVHLWNARDGWSILTEDERFGQKFADGLPEMCFSVLPHSGDLICIKRGESGYYPSDWSTDDRALNAQMADDANEKLGVSQEQRQAMEIGSMFGWNVPGADPAAHIQQQNQDTITEMEMN